MVPFREKYSIKQGMLKDMAALWLKSHNHSMSSGSQSDPVNLEAYRGSLKLFH